jgi:hypothetical protein
MNTNENVTKWVDLVMGKSSVTPTYSFVDGRPVHTGYLVLHPDYRLKWSIRGAWDELRARPDFGLNESRYVGMLQNAQP